MNKVGVIILLGTAIVLYGMPPQASKPEVPWLADLFSAQQYLKIKALQIKEEYTSKELTVGYNKKLRKACRRICQAIKLSKDITTANIVSPQGIKDMEEVLDDTLTQLTSIPEDPSLFCTIL